MRTVEQVPFHCFQLIRQNMLLAQKSQNQLLLMLVKTHFVTAMIIQNLSSLMRPQKCQNSIKLAYDQTSSLFDPIRAGCKEEVLTSAASMEPNRIVYVSCNPATMARDIEILTHYGYELKEVQPVDMFPMTAHVEAVALLTRKEITQ